MGGVDLTDWTDRTDLFLSRGAWATADYQGDGLSVVASEDGVLPQNYSAPGRQPGCACLPHLVS